MLGRIVGPDDLAVPLARIFVFGAGTRPSFTGIYKPVKRITEQVVLTEIISFTKSRKPRIEPHIIQLAGDQQIQVYSVSGCGCGSPLKKINYNLALTDWDANPQPIQYGIQGEQGPEVFIPEGAGTVFST